MESAIPAVAAASLLAFAGVASLLRQPRETESRLLATALLLLAASTVAFHAFRTAATPAGVAAAMRLILWFEIPALVLLLVLLDRLFLPWSARRHRLVAAVAGAALVALLALLVADPRLFVADVVVNPAFVATGVGGRFTQVPGPLGEWHGTLYYAFEAAAVALAAWSVGRPDLPRPIRQRDAVVGVAFAFLLGHTGGGVIAAIAWAPATLASVVFSVKPAVALAGGVIVIAAAPRLARAFSGGARTAVAVALVLPLLAGAFDASYAHLLELGLSADPGYRSSRLAWLAAFAGALALAAARYGLVRPSESEPPRGAIAGTYVGVVLGAAIAVGLPGGGIGLTPLGLLALAAVAASPLALLLARWPRPATRLVDSPPPVGVYAPPDGLLLGRYLVERELGRGGAAVAHLATDTLIGRRVVVKRLRVPGENGRHLADEMRALARVRHPLVLTLYHAEALGDDLVLVLEHAPGGTLEDRLAREGPLATREAVAAVSDVLAALDAVHAAGLVHGDVKAANVLVGDDGRVRVGDFGLARAFRRDADATAATSLSGGTLSAMAPEQVKGGPRGPRTDVYSAGALLYRLLTGEHYVDLAGLGEWEAMERVLSGAPRLPHARVPEAVASEIARALAKEPAARHESAAALREALAVATRASSPRAAP